ncbi:MAG: PQQ-dependent sugar dehydrogenase [Vicinamibacterales bacterium]
MGILLHAAAADAAAIRLAWDPSRTAGVIGYRVYVGTASRAYTEIHDVGQATWFSYEGLPGLRYYFAVASYLPGPVEGPPSEEVSGYATDTPPPTSRLQDYELAGLAAGDANAARLPRGQLVCAEPPARDCFDATPVVDSAREITSLAVLPDGRVLFIEDSRRVRIIAEDRLLPEPALDVGPFDAIGHIAIDPQFSTNGFVFMGLVEGVGRGPPELRIVRLRMVQNQLGEAATIVTGLPLGPHRHAPFAIDGDGHLYVALPAADHSSGSTGTILRFRVDGTVPRDNPTVSSVLGHGHARPLSVEWDAPAGRLWLSGTGGFSQPVAYLDMGELPASREWPRLPRSASVHQSGVAVSGPATGIAARGSFRQAVMMVPANDPGVPQQARPNASSEEFVYLRLDEVGTLLAVASGPDGRIHIALREPALDAFRIVQLQPRR